MTRCPACHQMMPELEVLSDKMKSIGIKVGRVNIDYNQDLARMYSCYTLPKLMLFRPNKEPLEYQYYRTAKEMGKFVTSKLLGSKQVAVVSTDERFDKFFNESSKVPRLLLLSERSTPPPLLKNLCFKNRRGVICGFVSNKHLTIHKVQDKIEELGHLNKTDYELPAIFSIDHEQSPVMKLYEEKMDFDNINKFVAGISLEEKLKKMEEEEEEKELEKKKKRNSDDDEEEL